MINVLNKGLGFPIVSDAIFGEIIKMSASQAFDYALVTGASYLTSEYGLVISGRLTIFYHRNYSFVPGLFNRNHGTGSLKEGDSPLAIKLLNPEIFEGDKYILFVNIKETSNIESVIYSKLKKDGRNPSDYLLTKVMPSGAGAEHFCEYVSCMIFNRLNYLTESQPPWSYYGNPDFAAYRLSQLSDLWERGFLQEGCLVQDLSTLTVFGKRGKRWTPDLPKEYEFVIGEAKTLSGSCTAQLRRYLNSGLCTSAYEIIPHKVNPENGYGLISFNSDGTINFYSCKLTPKLNMQARERDKKWLLDYVKTFLIANLPLEEIKSFIKAKLGTEKLTPKVFIQFIRKLSFASILNKVEDHIS